MRELREFGFKIDCEKSFRIGIVGFCVSFWNSWLNFFVEILPILILCACESKKCFSVEPYHESFLL